MHAKPNSPRKKVYAVSKSTPIKISSAQSCSEELYEKNCAAKFLKVALKLVA